MHEGTVAQQNAFCAGFFGPGFPIVPGATDCFGFTEPDDGDNKLSVDEIGFFQRDHFVRHLDLYWDDY